ncbi:MAG TPA: MoaD/ThiS family protein [Gammaproteobacteria bacterium]|nr:MoaD/ThiS family protein [Gammaproteobacteria bacterium]
MARVILQGELARRYTGGQATLVVQASDYSALVAELKRRYPGLVEAIGRRTAVAIDGEIFHDPLHEPIAADSEVHFMPLIGGG